MSSQTQSQACNVDDTGSSYETAIKGLQNIRADYDYKSLVKATIRAFVLDLGDDDSGDEQDRATASDEGLSIWPQLRQDIDEAQKDAASRLIAFDELSHLLTTALQQSSLKIRSQNWDNCRTAARSRVLLYNNMKDFFKMASAESQKAILGSVILSSNSSNNASGKEPTSDPSMYGAQGSADPTSAPTRLGSDILERTHSQLADLDTQWRRIVDTKANETMLTELGSKMLCEVYPTIEAEAEAALSRLTMRRLQKEVTLAEGDGTHASLPRSRL